MNRPKHFEIIKETHNFNGNSLTEMVDMDTGTTYYQVSKLKASLSRKEILFTTDKEKAIKTLNTYLLTEYNGKVKGFKVKRSDGKTYKSMSQASRENQVCVTRRNIELKKKLRGYTYEYI